MTQPTAMVTTFLAWSLLAFPTGYSKSDNTAEVTAAVRWGAEYLLKLFIPTVGSNYDGGATIIYQVSKLQTIPSSDTVDGMQTLYELPHCFSCWRGQAYVAPYMSLSPAFTTIQILFAYPSI